MKLVSITKTENIMRNFLMLCYDVSYYSLIFMHVSHFKQYFSHDISFNIWEFSANDRWEKCPKDWWTVSYSGINSCRLTWHQWYFRLTVLFIHYFFIRQFLWKCLRLARWHEQFLVQILRNILVKSSALSQVQSPNLPSQEMLPPVFLLWIKAIF